MTQEKTKTGRATRRVYIPLLDKSNQLVTYKDVEFDWHMGMSAAVRKRSIHSLHENIIKTRIGERPLEISSKSEEKLGIALSAFNLKGKTKKGVFTVETLFQSSKVFKEDEKSPYRDLLYKTSREAKNPLN